ncbi:hypothetical protein INR76_07865 [Marixanthomonas sp. SCSIO 43207]|uniref:hypothetical protein n=1 Tax=Marixanthomonas sp. SCSIO 43207 TaxID=2779360 RepID=UPI001CA8D0D9|nr:hypothetical protein [Marixanthomonas sp. SCSIO 43207]UAB80053.1 hypothetical protein INR76_07865 [Marixanthomonas sp. SCSIO 43207]
MKKIRFFGLFQFINQTYNQIVRHPYEVNKDYFDNLKTRHFTKEFTSKYNENLFVDQDKNSGQTLINEILLNKDHFPYLLNELRILSDWLEDFSEQYQNLKSLLAVEEIEINKNSKQYKQLELLEVKRHGYLEAIKENQSIINGGLVLPLGFKTLDKTNLEIPEDFVFERLHEYNPENRFIEEEPSELFALVVVFRRLSEIITQLKTVNKLLENQKNAQIKFIHGNAGMGKSNFSAFIYTELLKQNKPVIIIGGKSFNGDPDSFATIFMDNLMVPNNYQIEEVLGRLNKYGEKNKCRVTLIIDGLNETSFAHSGFSKLWENSLDNFIETLKNYPYIYLIATLRTSYVSRIWNNNSIPYAQIQLNGFKGHKLEELVKKYFIEYKINIDPVTPTDIYYFSTPLYLDLYCKMLNGNKINQVEPLLGLDGFKQVFDTYISNLSEKARLKLGLMTRDQVLEGIDRVSKEMIDELEAFVNKVDYYEKMEGKVVDRIEGTIGLEILEEYLIYLDENLNDKDVIVHTQQEVGGYLLAKKLISDNGSVDNVVTSDFFQDYILGNSGKHHQLKDDILKFLIVQSDSNSLLFANHIEEGVIKKFTTLNLLRSESSDDNKKLASLLLETDYSLEEVRTLISDASLTFYDSRSNINFLFIKEVLLKLDNYTFDFAWTYMIYLNSAQFREFLDYHVLNPGHLEAIYEDRLELEVAIWLTETTIRDLRDKSTRFLIRFFERFPNLILDKVLEYSNSQRTYIQERLALVCYGVCLRLQNDKHFIENHLGTIAEALYQLQFSKEPSNPTYNYIVIDSYKHIIDLAIIKGVFNLSDENLSRLSKYSFVKDDWFEITQADIDNVPIAHNWSLDGNPDPLRGDFVHYTIPRLDNRDHESRPSHTANIFKELIRLGYISDMQNLSEREQSFYYGNRLLGSKMKIDRLGKKYSWMAYFNYAGYLLSMDKLGVWIEEDSSYTRYYNRLSDTEIEPSYEEYEPISEKLIDVDFFKNRSLTDGSWVNEPNYASIEALYERDDYTLLSAFIDQKLDEKYKTRSWVEAKSFFVDKDKVVQYIGQLENREYDWNFNLHDGGMLSKTYFGELYWADNIPSLKREGHSLPLESTKEITRTISHFEVRESGEFNFEDVGKEITETVNETCYFEYEPALMDFLWESGSDNVSSLRCDVPSPNLGKHLDLTVNSRDTQILDSNLEVCFKEYHYEYGFNSDNFHYIRTDLLKKYLEDTNQLLMYQLKQHTYDQATEAHHEHFRGMQFVFSKLNR